MNRTHTCFCFSALLYAAVLAGILTLCLNPPKAESRFAAVVEEGDPFTPLTDSELARLPGDSGDSQPVIAIDTGPTAIAVELSDFSEETAPKNDLMASIRAFIGTGLNGRLAPLPWYRRYWGD